jgi:carboxylate-amine ligase
MADRFGALAEKVICGAHVHVGVPDRDEAAAVSNHLRPWLPVLLALTANSPIIAGRDTGYASWRHILWSRWPSAGPPPYFRSAQHYDSVVARMLENKSILDTAMIYWDIRLSAHLPTIEVRIADVPATAAETVLLATLIRGLVAAALTDIRRGVPAPILDQQVLRAAYWRAARDGMTGHGIDAHSTRLVPASGLLERLLTHVRPELEQHDDYDTARAAVTQILATGNGAARQRRALRSGSLTAVLDLLTHTTTEGC